MNRNALIPSLIIAFSFAFAGMATVASAQPNPEQRRVVKKKHVKKAPRKHVKPAPTKHVVKQPARKRVVKQPARKRVVKQPARKRVVKQPVHKAPKGNVKKVRADKNRDGVVTPREKRAAKAKRRQ